MNTLKLFAFLLGALIATSSHAADVRLSYGLGMGERFQTNTDIKNADLAFLNRIGEGPFCWRLNGGFFSDVNNDPVFTGYAFAGIGTHVRPIEFLYLENFFSPLGLISSVNNRLGSYFQFGIDLGFGFVEAKSGAKIGLGWKHISNAGIQLPNQGYDMMLITLGYEF